MPAEIYLNVYDITCFNSFLNCFGIGVYHTGLQIDNIEYRFGAHSDYDTGVETNDPKDGMGIYKFYKSIYIGECKLEDEEIEEIIEEISMEYLGRSYDLLKRNCNHFSQDLCFQLTGKQIPKFVFHLSNCLKFTRCIISQRILRGGFDVKHNNEKDSLFLGKKRIVSHHKKPDQEMQLLDAKNPNS